MSNLVFNGKISKILPLAKGEGRSGEWAKASFEVTESNPKNEDYPQIGLFDLFKSGERLKTALEFSNNFKVGDEVTVEFNLKKSVYQKKDGSGEGQFYSTPCWRIDKIEGLNSGGMQMPPATGGDVDELPF